MKRKDRLPELLAPAGNFEALIAAVEAGADAVYVGGKSFGARAFAENFDIELLSRAVEYTHLNGVKLFVTVNTLVYDRELDALSEYVRTLYEIGVDAIICADLGVLGEIRRSTPNMPVHASTQMSINNTAGANLAYEMGCERVVLARELSLLDIRSAVENSKPEIEVFLHGALCVCHSGQCLFSSLVGGRSGNRGECAQPCRLPYDNGKYPLSLSDLSLARHVGELCEAGVASLKIEGRMKSADYVYNVTGIYRRLLDELRDATDAEEAILKKTFSRGDFTDGYFINKKFSKMTGIRAESDKTQTREMVKREYREKIHPTRAFVKMRLSEPCEMRLEMKNGARSAVALGQAPEPANTRPLNEVDVKARLSKMGGTYFSLDPEDIELSLDENVNLSPAAINALRRDAVAKLSSFKREPCESQPSFKKSVKKPRKLNTGLFLNAKEYEKYSLSDTFFDICFLPIEYFESTEYGCEGLGVYLPPAAFDSELARVRELLVKARELSVKYALCTNLSQIEMLEELGFEIIGDFRLNVSNSLAAAKILELGIGDIILHPEITLPMARDIGGGVIVYGRIPLMLTERCFIKENFGCENCSKAHLTDRTGAKFPLLYEFGHRNLILNSAVTYMGDKKKELERAGIYHRHFIFSTETAAEISAAVKAYAAGEKLPAGIKIRRVGIN